MKLMSLDENVIRALDFLGKNKPPKVDLDQFRLPFVVGSGNAINSGRIMFSGRAAIFSDESDFKQNLKAYAYIIKKKLIKDCVVISASGEKDSIWEVEWANKHKLKTTLLTCNKNSSAAQIADQVFGFRKIPEPYTYNVSTYMGMILSTTQEKPELIKKFITSLGLPKSFNSYLAYSFLLPDEFINICPMLDIKKSELFGPHLPLRSFTQGHARHAKFVIPWEKELVITLGKKNQYFGHSQHRWDIKLPPFADFATVLALTYFLIGKIQAAKPQYFKNNIKTYCVDYGPKAYGKDKPFDIIVPGN
jgi:hypothetical protein